jgi:hypothetical protein
VSRDLHVDTDQLDRISRALGEPLTSLAEPRRALEHVRADQLGTQERWPRAADAYPTSSGTGTGKPHGNRGPPEETDHVGGLPRYLRNTHRSPLSAVHPNVIRRSSGVVQLPWQHEGPLIKTQTVAEEPA